MCLLKLTVVLSACIGDKLGRTQDHAVYNKSAHTHLQAYCHAKSDHRPSAKKDILSTLVGHPGQFVPRTLLTRKYVFNRQLFNMIATTWQQSCIVLICDYFHILVNLYSGLDLWKMNKNMNSAVCKIVGFRRGGTEFFHLLGYYAA
jgi:hypothetical protein